MSEKYDLVVIGSGPGGYVAAIRAAQLGSKVAVVEKDPRFGGTCLHRGCIPTKALLQTAATLDEVRSASKFGVIAAPPELDVEAAHAYKNKVVSKNAKGIEYLFRKNKIDGIRGYGRLAGANSVAVEPVGEGDEARTLEASHILIATGSVPREISIAPSDGEKILTSDHALELPRVPKSIAVLGAGAVGCEFASIFASFGSDVTIIEMLPRLLPIEDEEVSKGLARAFRKRGILSLTDTRLESVEVGEQGLDLTLRCGDQDLSIMPEVLLVAVGRAPVTADLGLEEVGVELRDGYIGVDEMMRTSVPNIYAIGDVVQTPWLAHVASSEGILVAEHLSGSEVRPIDYDRVPSCTYCDPEVASVGLTEAAARDRGLEVETGMFPFSALGKAGILGATEGFVKVIRDTEYDELVGVHIFGPHATDLIAEACVALQLESTTEELMRTMHAHPTLSEAVMEAAHAALGHAIHS